MNAAETPRPALRDSPTPHCRRRSALPLLMSAIRTHCHRHIRGSEHTAAAAAVAERTTPRQELIYPGAGPRISRRLRFHAERRRDAEDTCSVYSIMSETAFPEYSCDMTEWRGCFDAINEWRPSCLFCLLPLTPGRCRGACPHWQTQDVGRLENATHSRTHLR